MGRYAQGRTHQVAGCRLGQAQQGKEISRSQEEEISDAERTRKRLILQVWKNTKDKEIRRDGTNFRRYRSRYRRMAKRVTKEGRARQIAAGVYGKLGGRPGAFSSPEELTQRIQEYMDFLMECKRFPTNAGLAHWLGVSRDTLNEYSRKKGFSDVVAQFDNFSEDMWLQNLTRPNSTGTAFYLKNRFAYADTIDHTSGGKPITYTIPKEIAEKHKLLVLDKDAPPTPITPEDDGEVVGAKEISDGTAH